MVYGIGARQAGFRLVCAKGSWLFNQGSWHVKRDAILHGLTTDESRRQRMALVEDAYQQFRKKWNIAVPESWGSGATVDPFGLLDQANAHSHAVQLKYEFPVSVLSELEFH
jgi:hypothetical protein